MNTFKHKKSGLIATQIDDCNYELQGGAILPKIIVESSNDWVVCKVPLFITMDGVTIYSGDSWYYVVEGSERIRNTNTLVYKGKHKNNVYRFANRVNAEKHIISSNKCLSVNDLIAAKKGMGCFGDTLITIAFDLAKSKTHIG